MEIHKAPLSLLIPCLWLFLSGCLQSSQDQESEEIKSLRHQIKSMNTEIKLRQELLDKWFHSFQQIKDSILSIKTDELIFQHIGIGIEGMPIFKTDKELILNKIQEINILLDQKVDELKNDQLYNHLKGIIDALKTELNRKEKTIIALQENVQILEEQKNLAFAHLEEANRVIEEYSIQRKTLEELLANKRSELSKNYVLLIARKELDFFEINSLSFYLPNRPWRHEVLSEHPHRSYSLSRSNSKSLFIIHDNNFFWRETNILVIRVKSRRL